MSAKQKLAQQARREREKSGVRTIPVLEGKKIIKYIHINEGKQVENFVSLYKKANKKPRAVKRKNTVNTPFLDLYKKLEKKKTKNTNWGCGLLTIIYFIGLPTYLWATQSATEITGIVEAKEEPIIVTRVLEVEEEIKTQPEVKIEVTEPVFDSSREDLESYIKLKFASLGQEAVDWALFTADQESKFMERPHNLQDDHSAWCNLENGSHGLYHFSTCTFKGLGGTDIINPYEQIDIVSRPEVYENRAFYWYYSTNKFEAQR